MLDLALAAAEREAADIVLANDPDADRLAVAIPARGRRLAPAARRRDRRAAGRLPARAHGRTPRARCSSPPSRRRRCSAAWPRRPAPRFAETLTGFKWIMRAVAEQPERRAAARLRGGARLRRLRRRARQGRHLRGARDGAARRRGASAPAGRSSSASTRSPRATAATPPSRSRCVLEGADGARADARRSWTRSAPTRRRALLGRRGHRRSTTCATARAAPAAPTCWSSARSGARVVIRPSGTEPKLKAYLEVVVDGDRAAATAALARLRAEVEAAARGGLAAGELVDRLLDVVLGAGRDLLLQLLERLLGLVAPLVRRGRPPAAGSRPRRPPPTACRPGPCPRGRRPCSGDPSTSAAGRRRTSGRRCCRSRRRRRGRTRRRRAGARGRRRGAGIRRPSHARRRLSRQGRRGAGRVRRGRPRRRPGRAARRPARASAASRRAGPSRAGSRSAGRRTSSPPGARRSSA